MPDENFYKALNAVHGEANTEMQLAMSASQSIEDLMSAEDDDEDGSGKVVLPPNRSSSGYSKQGTFADFLKGFDKNGKPKKARRGSQGSDSDVDAKSMTSSIRSSLSANTVKSEEVGEFPLPGELSPGYENATPPTPPTISHYPKKKKKASSPPQLQPKMKKSKGKLSMEATSDHTTTGGHHSEKAGSPLTVIGGKYSFSVTEKSGAATAAGEEPLSQPQVANGKPLYPSLQTAMRPQNQQPQNQQPPTSQSKKSKKKGAATSSTGT